MRLAKLAGIIALVMGGQAVGQSVVGFELELGGDNHGAQGDVLFTPGDPSNGQTFGLGSTITWGARISAGGVQQSGNGAGYEIKGTANFVFTLELHAGSESGPLATDVTFVSTANGGTVVTETRRGGIRKIVADFDSDVSASYTAGRVVVNGGTITPAGEALVNGGTRLEIYFDPDQLPDMAYYAIDIGDSVSCLGGDTDCIVRALAGDTNNDGNTNLIDMAQTKSKNGMPPAGDDVRFDVNVDGNTNLIDMALVKSLNGNGTPVAAAAFAYTMNVAGWGPARVIDPLAPGPFGDGSGGPRIDVHTYPNWTAVPGMLLGMGAGYSSWDRTPDRHDLWTIAGVGQVALQPGDPVFGPQGTGPVCEGQIDTTGLSAGVYVLKVVAEGGNNVLRGDIDLSQTQWAFATPADETVSDTITFELVEEGSCQILSWTSVRDHGPAGELPIVLNPVVQESSGLARGGNVDQEMFGHLQACLSGPGGGETDPNCQDVDFDADGDVDQADLRLLEDRLSGSNVPADSNRAD